jgi:hypothetical protein
MTATLTDPEVLRDRDGVPLHEETVVADAETVETVADMDDMAPVGVTNAAGEVLVMRITDTCSWKIPTTSVGSDEAFDAAARDWIAENAGIDVVLDGAEAVWYRRFEAEDGVRTASRYFVVYGGTPTADDPAVPTADAPDPAVEADWVTSLPEGATEVPGTELFL